jgi:hypothetical protein
VSLSHDTELLHFPDHEILYSSYHDRGEYTIKIEDFSPALWPFIHWANFYSTVECGPFKQGSAHLPDKYKIINAFVLKKIMLCQIQ